MRGLVWAVLATLQCAASAAPGTVLSCDECLMLAKLLQVQLAKLEPDDQEADSLVGSIRPRRRMLHPRSEPQIFGVLDSLCEVASAKLGQPYKTPCNRIIAQHRDALENGIYADGLEHVRHLLCMDLVHACGGHALYDSGEL